MLAIKFSLLLFLLPLTSALKSKVIRPPLPRPNWRPKYTKGKLLPKNPKEQDFLFTATSPKIVSAKGGELYPVIIVLERAAAPTEFELKIITMNREEEIQNNGKKFRYVPETVSKGQSTLEPDTSALVELKIPPLSQFPGNDAFNITIKATCKESGKSAEDYGIIYPERKSYSIIIQTDKPIYKPGETVSFRVLFLDRFLKPVEIDLEAKKVTIEIFDGQRNKVKSWTGKDVPLKKKYGFVKESILLSKEPNLGDWSVEVSTKGGSSGDEGEEERTSQSFSVDQYVLPKFKVELTATPTFVTYNDSSFSIEVKSTYTHGKGVKGPCTLKVRRSYEPYIYELQMPNPSDDKAVAVPVKRPQKTTKTKEVEGSAHFQFDLKEDIDAKESEATDWGMDVVVDASCTEAVTGKIQNATIQLKMYKFPWTITTVDQPQSYKPGFNLTLTIKVARHDGTPVSDPEPTALKIRHGFSYNAEDGELSRSIPQNGLVYLTFVPPSNEMINVNGIEASYKGFTQWLGVPSRQVSKTNSYMVLSVQKKRQDTSPKFRVGTTVPINVQMNKGFDSLTWLVIGKGSILKWDRVTNLPNDPMPKEYTLPIPLEVGMEPQIQLLVYTVLQDKEDLVAESIKLDIQPSEDSKLILKVKDFTDFNKTVEPGANISISCQGVWSSSLLALRAVDQSVLLLKEDRDIDGGTIKGIEDDYVNGMGSMRTWGGSDTFQIYENLGLNIMTNAMITKNEYNVYPVARYNFGGPRMMMKAAKMAAPMAMMEMDDAAGAAPMARGRAFAANSGAESAPEPSIRIRKSFPETWIFKEFEQMEGRQNKMQEISEMVPDTITSWVISAFQISPEQGLGISSSTKLTVFRPFFIVLNVPYSVIKGEVFSLQVLVHNYLDHAVGAKVTLSNDDGAFALQGDSSLVRELASLQPSSVGVVSFLISPSKIGSLTLNLKAVTSTNEAGDGLTQPLLVKPPGVKQSKNNALFLNLLGSAKGSKLRKNLTAIFPDKRVPESETLKVTVIGDILGGTMTNLDSLIALPCGCGEQNMINFVPDIVVLDYLKVTSSLTKDVRVRALSFLETGYQRELTFRRWDGSFSAFGNSDSAGSTWLTAFVVRSFISAKRYISIDDSVLMTATDFLIRQQSENGSFVENGYIHDLILQGGGGGSPYALTAFTLLTFLDAKSLPSLSDRDNPKDYAKIIDSGLNWLLNETPNIQDTYSIILICYLLHLLDHPKKEHYFKLVEDRSLSDSKGAYKYWEKNRDKKEKDAQRRLFKGPITIDDNYWGPWYQVKPASVEMSSYALLIYLLREKGELRDSISIGRWLLKQRNCNGGFMSTQDTVVGLTALAKFAEATFSPEYEMAIKVNYMTLKGSPASYNFGIGRENISTLQEYFIPLDVAAGLSTIEVEAEGVGSALVQLSWNYYTMNAANNSGFTLDVQVEPKDKNRRLEYNICTSYVLGDKSNMAIMEVNTPTGYTFDHEELQELKQNQQIKREETEDGDTKLNIYFNFLSAAKTCVSLKAHRIHFVAKHSKSSVAIYDYYDTTKKVTSLYDGPVVEPCEICGIEGNCKELKCL